MQMEIMQGQDCRTVIVLTPESSFEQSELLNLGEVSVTNRSVEKNKHLWTYRQDARQVAPRVGR